MHRILTILSVLFLSAWAGLVLGLLSGCSTTAVMRIATGDIASEKMVLEINEQRSEQFRTVDGRLKIVEGAITLSAEDRKRSEALAGAGKAAEGTIAKSVEAAQSQGSDLMAIIIEALKVATGGLGGMMLGRKVTQMQVEKAYLSPTNTNRALEDSGIIGRKAQKLKWNGKRKEDAA